MTGNPPSDEVSLRDLWLILRRGLGTILVVALVAAVLGYLAMWLRPPAYQAEATVTSRAPTVRMLNDMDLMVTPDGRGTPPSLAVDPPSSLSFEAYRALSESRLVFESALARATVPGGSIDVASLEAAAELTEPGRSQTPLIVVHRVTWSDPAIAAELANAWAEASVDHARGVLSSELGAVVDTTRSVASARLAEVERIESELEALTADRAAGDERQIARLERELAAAERSHAAIADLEPLVTYVADVVPSGTQVLTAAAMPLEPAGRSPLLAAAVAFVLGAFAATIFVFLREAVRDPAHDGPRTGSPVEGRREATTPR